MILITHHFVGDIIEKLGKIFKFKAPQIKKFISYRAIHKCYTKLLRLSVNMVGGRSEGNKQCEITHVYFSDRTLV